MADTVVDIPIFNPKDCPPRGEGRAGSPSWEGGFLAGPENRLVELAVHSILREEANGYNPVILYGSRGLGKTHLALGVAAEWKTRHRQKQVEGTTALEFSQELAEAIETQGVEEFREKYRRAAFVVLEDIHRLAQRRAEKLSAQEELIHTFDVLIKQGTWILITSAAAPSECSGFLPAVQSRLIGGLVVPLALPSIETRLAIIQRYSLTMKMDLSKAATQILAERLHGSVSEIIQALRQLASRCVQEGTRIDIRTAKCYLASRTQRHEPSLQEVTAVIAKHFGLKMTQLCSSSRKRAIVSARDLAIYLSRCLLKSSMGEIGRYFGGRDHATVIYSCRKIDSQLKKDRVIRREVELLKEQVNRLG